MKAEYDESLGEAADVQERLRAAAESANGAGIGRVAEHESNRAARRARQAREWARSRVSDLQDRVEERPYSATAWALGIGLIAGILLATLVRTRRD